MPAYPVGLTAYTFQYRPHQAVALSNVTIAFIFYMGIFNTCGIDLLIVAYPVEVRHTHIRAKGMGLNNFVRNGAEFINAYATPIGLKNTGWRMHIVYIVWNIEQAAWVFLFFVKTKYHALEDMGEIFESKNRVKASLEKPNRVAPIALEDGKV
jgi:hypothetical protein